MKHVHSLSVLAAHVPACTIGQAARIWGMSYRSAALKLGDFERAGLVRSAAFVTRFFDRPTEPIHVHRPPTEIVREQCRQLSARFRARYRRAKIVPLHVRRHVQGTQHSRLCRREALDADDRVS